MRTGSEWIGRRIGAIGLFVAGTFLIALSGVISVPLLRSYSAAELTLIRFATVALALVPLVLFRSRKRPPSARLVLSVYVPLGLATLAGFFFYLQALRGISVAEATALFFCFPFLLVVFGFLFLKEPVSPWGWGQTLLGFIGIFLVLGGTGAPGWPQLAAVLSGVAVAARLILTRTASRTTPAIEIIAWESLVSSVVLVAIIDVRTMPLLADPWLLLAYLVMANLSRVCVIAALGLNTASTLAPLAFFELLFAAIIEGLLLGVWVTPQNGAAILVICAAGLGVALRRRPKSDSAP